MQRMLGCNVNYIVAIIHALFVNNPTKQLTKHSYIDFTTWTEILQQTNGDAITVDGQKPKLDNSMD